jgi:hypothetical protein
MLLADRGAEQTAEDEGRANGGETWHELVVGRREGSDHRVVMADTLKRATQPAKHTGPEMCRATFERQTKFCGWGPWACKLQHSEATSAAEFAISASATRATHTKFPTQILGAM